MAMKGYAKFTRAPELELHHQMLFFGESYPNADDAVCIF